VDPLAGCAFSAHFAALPDPRIDRCKRHSFLDVFAALDPAAFETAFLGWVRALAAAAGQVVAIDGCPLGR